MTSRRKQKAAARRSKRLQFLPLPAVTLIDLGPDSPVRGRAPAILIFSVFAIFFFPSNMVLKPLGAAGTVPLILALILLAFWCCAVLFGWQDPIGIRHPGRIGLAFLWLGTCASYIGLYSGLTGGSSVIARSAADRWMLLLFASSGLILVIAEVVRTLDDAMVVVRGLLAGAFFCCAVAVVQFVLLINPMDWVQSIMPGFTDNGGNTPFQIRGNLMRVAGSTFHSIELAVICAMLLPLSIWRGLYDRRGKKWFHWLGTSLLVFAIASTVSRSGILGLILGTAVFMPFLPTVPRRWAYVVAPVAVAGLFLAVPGLMGTLTSSLTAGDSDPSISTRTNNYPRVAGMVSERPWIGAGPGNYMPTNALYILDNQYLNSAVTMGVVGLVGVIFYLFLPGLATLLAARTAKTEALKCLAGAVAAAGIVAGVCSLTFDSMSFPVFALTYPVIVGIAGAAWSMVRLETRLLKDAKQHPPADRKSWPTKNQYRKGTSWIR